MAVQNFDVLSGKIIDAILIVEPEADIKVGQAIRDLFIDIQAAQLESLYSIANNTALAMSINTAVNQQLDRYANNFGTSRKSATRSGTTLTLSIKSGVSVPTPLNIGDQFYTEADANNNIVTFVNTQYQLLQPGQTQATIPLTSLNTGYNQNVAAYTITQSSYDFVDSVYNVNAAIGGADQESNANFALRIPYVFTGQYINVTRGIINSILNIGDINGTPFFVTPDNPLSRGLYCIDVYLQRTSQYYGTTTSEIAPANQQDYIFQNQPLYSLNPINQITIFDPTTNITTISPSSSYEVINDPADVPQFYLGSIQANQKLHWLTSPPTTPYTISYNYDHTIIDAQSAYDVHNELVANVLYKQANAIPMYIEASLLVSGGTNFSTTYSNAMTNLNNLFDSLQITQSLTIDDVKFALLQDKNILAVNLNNLDTTFEVILTPGTISSFITPNNQSELTPLGFYWQTDNTSTIAGYNIVASLFIGKPNIIVNGNQNTTTNFNFYNTNTIGVVSEKMINNIATSWTTQVLSLYDPTNQLLILNFTVLPSSTDTITFNLLQDNITVQNLSYLTLAPALVSPVNAYSSTLQNQNPIYATMLPSGLSSTSQATLYKNGVPLVQTNSSSVGDYQIVANPNPSNGIINIQFTTTPLSADVFNYGVLNPSLQISYSTSQFLRS